MEFSSRIIEEAVREFSQLPGVGKKTALRFVLHVLKKDQSAVQNFSNAILRLRNETCFCKSCHNISDKEECEICANSSRDASLVCVVQDIRDVMAIENTNSYKGKFHVLGGIISPMDGVGPSNLNIESLVEKVSQGNVKEVIIALNSTMEGETTAFYIFKRISNYSVEISTIARGIPVGDELEYADEITLGRSMQNRIPYTNQSIAK